MQAPTIATAFLVFGILLARADPAVSNLGQPNGGFLNSNVGTAGPTGSAAAQGFVTGSQPLGYELSSVTLRFLAPGRLGSPGDLDVELWDSVGGKPGTIIAEFGVNNPDAGGDFTFPLDPPVTLAQGTRYFIVASTPDAPTSGGQHVYFWEGTSSTDENAGKLPGWSIDNGFRTSQGVVDPDENTPWGNELSIPLQLAIHAVVASPPVPPEITGFSHDPDTGNSEVTIKGAASTRFKLVEAADLDFTTPDQDPVPLATASVGTLDGDAVLTDANGNATVTLALPTGTTTFIRAEEAP